MNFEPSAQVNLFAHNALLNDLINLYNKNKLPNKILLSGEKGIGKSTLAYHLINHILSQNEEYSYEHDNYRISNKNKSFKLIQNKTSPNFYLINVTKDKKNIDINQIRNLILNLYKSSFNSKPRFVLIDNIELLNLNSVNALLKILEEPNDNINFLLINNNKKILSTLKSRCLEFKVFLSRTENIEVINNILNENIYDIMNNELINSFATPGKLCEIIKFSKDIKINLKDYDLKNLILLILETKIYKKEKSINEILYFLIELYLRNNSSVTNIYLLELSNYFLKKINNTKIYNLDEEILYIEFKDKVLNV